MWAPFKFTTMPRAFTNLKVSVHKTPSDNEVADILTKPLPKEGAQAYRAMRATILGLKLAS